MYEGSKVICRDSFNITLEKGKTVSGWFTEKEMKCFRGLGYSFGRSIPEFMYFIYFFHYFGVKSSGLKVDIHHRCLVWRGMYLKV